MGSRGAFAFELLFGAEPVVELVSRGAAARQKNLMGAFTNLLLGKEVVGWRGWHRRKCSLLCGA